MGGYFILACGTGESGRTRLLSILVSKTKLRIRPNSMFKLSLASFQAFRASKLRDGTSRSRHRLAASACYNFGFGIKQVPSHSDPQIMPPPYVKYAPHYLFFITICRIYVHKFVVYGFVILLSACLMSSRGQT